MRRNRSIPPAVKEEKEAAAYLTESVEGLREIVEQGRIPEVDVRWAEKGDPYSAPRMFRVVDLDGFLKQNSDMVWQPAPRIGKEASLDSAEAAAYLGLTRNQLMRLISRKKVPFRRQGYFFRFSVGQLDEYLERRVSNRA